MVEGWGLVVWGIGFLSTRKWNLRGGGLVGYWWCEWFLLGGKIALRVIDDN